ncbi:cation transporter HKT2;2 isoform X2 [Nicotiana tabacum]|uniref:Cation transporter HKT22 isoform X2 n=1 Tax=Nicotiana tabacum TaxID=4097 RepID=A0A1S3ZJW2_TOBAC|nr:PREDICTED: sodium transporter HKT1-like isoform X2 [Nicotiana tabacum]
MKSLSYFGNKLQHLCNSVYSNLVCFVRSTCFLISCFYKFILLRVHKFFVQLFYFIFISLIGFWILRILKSRSTSGDFAPRNLDLYFTSVSAVTVSSMSTVEMEVFSNSQLILITFLMLIGGEVFTSMVGLHLIRPKFKPWRKDSKIESVISSATTSPRNTNFNDDIELNIVVIPDSPKSNLEKDEFDQDDFGSSSDTQTLKYISIKFLGVVVLVYFLVMHILGISSVLVYLACVSSTKDVLRNKGLKTSTFAIFTVVSTFASCGFVPTNENMAAFSKNSGLLLILIPSILFGNTLYPACLRVSVWFVGKFFKKREAKFLLKNSREIGHLHLFPGLSSRFLVVTVFGFISLQLFLFCTYEWNSDTLNGLNSYQKIVGSFYQVVNTRHAGESVVDISAIDPAVLVVLMAMMYLPPYTTFLPVKGVEEYREDLPGKKKERGKLAENVIFSQLSYIVIFIILICITERKSLKADPLNFNVFNIAFEVIREME